MTRVLIVGLSLHRFLYQGNQYNLIAWLWERTTYDVDSNSMLVDSNYSGVLI